MSPVVELTELWLILEFFQKASKDVLGVFEYYPEGFRTFLQREKKPPLHCQQSLLQFWDVVQETRRIWPCSGDLIPSCLEAYTHFIPVGTLKSMSDVWRTSEHRQFKFGQWEGGFLKCGVSTLVPEPILVLEKKKNNMFIQIYGMYRGEQHSLIFAGGFACWRNV